MVLLGIWAEVSREVVGSLRQKQLHLLQQESSMILVTAAIMEEKKEIMFSISHKHTFYNKL